MVQDFSVFKFFFFWLIFYRPCSKTVATLKCVPVGVDIVSERPGDFVCHGFVNKLLFRPSAQDRRDLRSGFQNSGTSILHIINNEKICSEKSDFNEYEFVMSKT